VIKLLNKVFYGIDETQRLGNDLSLFHHSSLRINLRRLNQICMVLMITETILLFLPERAFNYHPILWPFVIINAILLIFLNLMKINIDKRSNAQFLLIQIAMISNILILATSLNLASINKTDYIHPFIIALTFIGTGLQLTPVILTTLVLTTTSVNLIGMSFLQSNPEIYFTAATNIIVFTFVAWILAIQVSRTRMISWLNQREVLIQNEILDDLTKRDSMTRFFNHESILSHLGQQIELAKNNGQPLSVLILDVDDFKLINDTYGHVKGDEVLMLIARHINLSVRVSDIIGRYGGEEFFVIFPNTTLEEARIVSERIRDAIEKAVVEADTKVTISGGLALVQHDNVDDIIRKSDDRLYQAKRSGKNKIVSE